MSLRTCARCTSTSSPNSSSSIPLYTCSTANSFPSSSLYFSMCEVSSSIYGYCWGRISVNGRALIIEVRFLAVHCFTFSSYSRLRSCFSSFPERVKSSSARSKSTTFCTFGSNIHRSCSVNWSKSATRRSFTSRAKWSAKACNTSTPLTSSFNCRSSPFAKNSAARATSWLACLSSY